MFSLIMSLREFFHTDKQTVDMFERSHSCNKRKENIEICTYEKGRGDRDF